MSQLGICTFLVILAGCSNTVANPTGVVKGYVKLDGKPVKGGTIKFKSEKGGKVEFDIQANGFYHAPNVTTGKYQVAISTERAKNYQDPAAQYIRPGQKPDAKTQEMIDNIRKQSGPPLVYMKIPAKYKNFESSGLSVEVKGGTNEKDFELSK